MSGGAGRKYALIIKEESIEQYLSSRKCDAAVNFFSISIIVEKGRGNHIFYNLHHHQYSMSDNNENNDNYNNGGVFLCGCIFTSHNTTYKCVCIGRGILVIILTYSRSSKTQL